LFSPGTPVSSTNKTDSHDITEILLKVALNTINHKLQNNVEDNRLTNSVGSIQNFVHGSRKITHDSLMSKWQTLKTWKVNPSI
jgi:hypothetical protein